MFKKTRLLIFEPQMYSIEKTKTRILRNFHVFRQPSFRLKKHLLSSVRLMFFVDKMTRFNLLSMKFFIVLISQITIYYNFKSRKNEKSKQPNKVNLKISISTLNFVMQTKMQHENVKCSDGFLSNAF